MPVYKLVLIKNNKREVKWFETHEEAATHYNISKAMDCLNKIPTKGLSLEGRARVLLDNVDSLTVALSEVDQHIKEYVSPEPD